MNGLGARSNSSTASDSSDWTYSSDSDSDDSRVGGAASRPIVLGQFANFANTPTTAICLDSSSDGEDLDSDQGFDVPSADSDQGFDAPSADSDQGFDAPSADSDQGFDAPPDFDDTMDDDTSEQQDEHAPAADAPMPYDDASDVVLARVPALAPALAPAPALALAPAVVALAPAFGGIVTVNPAGPEPTTCGDRIVEILKRSPRPLIRKEIYDSLRSNYADWFAKAKKTSISSTLTRLSRDTANKKFDVDMWGDVQAFKLF